MAGGRNNQAIVDALEAMAQVMAQANQALHTNQNHNGRTYEFHGLGKFQKNNPHTFKGRHTHEGSQAWIQEIEKIFIVMACTDAQEVLFGTHMLSEEVEYWGENIRQRMEADNAEITWDSFKNEFLDKCFPDDVHNRQEIEFFELKQCNMMMVDYAANFEELYRFYPHYNGVGTEGSKCVKFKNGLPLEIKQFNRYQEIHRFSVLVNKCIIYDEDSRSISAYYKSMREKKNGNKNRVKPYMTPVAKWNQKSQHKAASGSEISGGSVFCSSKMFQV